jgi:hypothetical protein
MQVLTDAYPVDGRKADQNGRKHYQWRDRTSTGYCVATDGQTYDNFMGRWSSRLAPLFPEFAGIKAGDQGSRCWLRHRGNNLCSGVVGRQRGWIRWVRAISRLREGRIAKPRIHFAEMAPLTRIAAPARIG